MSKIKVWIQTCLVIIVSVIRFDVAKEAIGCYHNSSECKAVLPTCDEAVIILNDMKWHFKQNCTGECAQCCFHDPGDVNRSLSNSDSVAIYTSCHRQPACDPYIDLQTPVGFENGYLHVIYTCEQVTSSQADDTQTVPVHVIYAIIFPIIGLCIIVALAFIYRRFVNKRQDAVRPKEIEDGGNEPTVNDLHASDKETKPIEEAFIVSHISTKHSEKPRKIVKFTPRELDLYNTDVPSDVNNLNGTLVNVTKTEECKGHVESSDGYTTEETVTTKDAINEIPVNDTKERVAPKTTERECEQLMSQPNVMPSYNVTMIPKYTASSGYKTHKCIRYNHKNAIDKRKMRRSRKKQLQFIRNVKLFWRNREQRVSDSSSDDYLSTSSSCTESSRESNREESEHGQTVDHNATDVVPSQSSRLKGEQQTEKHESDVSGNETVDSGKGGYAKLKAITKTTTREPSNETIESQSVDTFEQQIIVSNGVSNDSNAVPQLSSTKVSSKHYISSNRPISNEASGNKESGIESANIHNRSDKSSDIPHVQKEGAIATSSVRYAKDKTITDYHIYDDYDMANGSTNNQNQIGNRTSKSVWCIPKPPDTKSDLQYKAKHSDEILNRSVSLNESDKRRDEVIYKRRKRKYESMRHAKRETIFEILQKLEAVPKGSILKKSKSMKESKRESDPNECQDDKRKHTRFEDDSNLTDSDKIHKLIEPQGQSVSELQTEMKQNVEKAPTFDRLPAYKTSPENLRKDNTPARSVVPLYGENTEVVISESLLISNPIVNGLHDVDTHSCDIISSNLRRNSNDEMDDAVKDAATSSVKKACTYVTTERNQNTISSQRQLNIRDKVIQKAKSETRASVVDTLNCQSDFTNEMLTNDRQSIHGFGGEVLDSSATVDKMEAEDGVVKPLSDVHNSVRENQHLKTHLHGFDTDRNDHIKEQTDQSLRACENGADNDLRNPVTKSNPFHSLSMQMKIDDTFLSRNETNDGLNGESGLENHSIETNNFLNDNYCSNYATNNASFRYSRKMINASNLPKSDSCHNEYSQNTGFERYDYPLEQHEVSGTISSPDQSDESLMHVNETDKYNEYQLPTRPKSSLGNRSRSTERYDYHQQCEEPTMQSSRTFTNALMKVTDTKYKLSSDKRHSTDVPTKSSLSLDIPIIQTDNASQSHSPVKVFSTNRSVENTTESFANTYAEQEQVLRQDGKSNVRKLIIDQPVNNLMGVSRPYKETHDYDKTPNFAIKSNIETEIINESQYSKKNKKVRGTLQKQFEEFDSRHSFMKSNMPTPFDLQEHTFKTFVPPRRSKTPTPGPTFDNRENQYEASIKGATERNVENKFPPSSYSGTKSTNNIRKLSGKMDSSSEVRERARIKSQDIENVKLLNRRLKDKNRVYANHESKEPVRERPKSAMFGRNGTRAESRSVISRNKSMSNARDANTQRIRSGNDHSQSRSSNREYQLTDFRRGKQGLLTGWSRWNHRLDSASDWHLQSTGTDVRLEEYDSEIENFFSNPDAEILQINSSTNYTRPSTGVSRSKSCKT